MISSNNQSDGYLSTRHLTDDQRLDWLQLIRSENVGPATFRDLINHFGDASGALAALPELSQRAGKKSFKVYSREKAEKELEEAARLNVRFLALSEPEYPHYLKAIDCPPPLLSVRGTLNLNQHPPVSMVGARNSSASGTNLARSFASELGKAPMTIVSGFARGIDIAAHQAAAQTGTICVLAGGANNIYPPQHEDLYWQLLEQGNAFVSEMSLFHKPRAMDFPRRNRLIAGIGLGVIVIEARRKSGSLITARLSNESGRLVFAIPGSPLDPRSAGGNDLLKKGAIIATEPLDVIEEIKLLLERPDQGELFEPANSDNSTDIPPQKPLAKANPKPENSANAGSSDILDALGPAPIDIDELARYCNLSISELQLALIELSLANRIEHHPGNRVSLIMNG